jgi:hypothetical protein
VFEDDFVGGGRYGANLVVHGSIGGVTICDAGLYHNRFDCLLVMRTGLLIRVIIALTFSHTSLLKSAVSIASGEYGERGKRVRLCLLFPAYCDAVDILNQL